MSRRTKSPRNRQTAGGGSRRKQLDANAQPAAAAPAPIGSGPANAIVPSAAIPADETGAEPRNHRELAQAIFAQCDMVTIGRELLESGNEKGASVRAGVFKTVVDWRYGKTDGDSQAGRTTVQIIWDLPGPARESADAE